MWMFVKWSLNFSYNVFFRLQIVLQYIPIGLYNKYTNT
jgi:hypothetical protein